MAISTTFDVDAFVRAIEGRDADAQIAAYAADAVIETVDHDNPPSRPAVLRGSEEIGGYLRDVCARDMRHQVTDSVLGADRFAFVVSCRYPEGQRVRCVGVAELRDGKIVRQSGVQAWDA
jgi:hypothetical protein